MKVKLLVSRFFVKKSDLKILDMTDQELEKEYNRIITNKSKLCSMQRHKVIDEIHKRIK